ncbi:MAG TPA: response regulator transcription factor [Candidatus Acidoferrales bacterium]|nr:response regulator transcription factor [Candidatus Acidoferrales bacterium]
MSHNSRPHRLKVCLLSPHPLVRSEFERVLPEAAFQISFRPLAQSSPSEVKQMAIPKAPVYVIDGQASPHVLHALMETILERYPKARVLVLASKHSDAGTFDLLKLGVKGLLAYGQAEKQWQDALPLVAAGGYWVPRSVLSRFVESIIAARKPGMSSNKTPGTLSRREREVLESLLQNLSNKEIASQLNISERTVKFHVSNLLQKHGVRRRADLIVMRFQEAQLPN